MQAQCGALTAGMRRKRGNTRVPGNRSSTRGLRHLHDWATRGLGDLDQVAAFLRPRTSFRSDPHRRDSAPGRGDATS